MHEPWNDTFAFCVGPCPPVYSVLQGQGVIYIGSDGKEEGHPSAFLYAYPQDDVPTHDGCTSQWRIAKVVGEINAVESYWKFQRMLEAMGSS